MSQLIKKLYSVKDIVSEEWHPPFLATNDKAALRFFFRTISNEAALTQTDFELYCIGDMDTINGTVTGMSARQIHITLGTEEPDGQQHVPAGR
jgi:hypothetical protein